MKKIKTPDYWDFRDGMPQVEKMRTMTTGGKNGNDCKKNCKEESKKETEPA